MTLLTLAGSNDVLARLFSVEVDRLNVWLRWSLLILPLLIGLAVFRICRELGGRGLHPVSRPKRLEVRWSEEGGFEDVEVGGADADEAGDGDR
jgi:hypothetical protein